MPLLKELKKNTADVLQLKINELKNKSIITADDKELFIKLESTLSLLEKTGFQEGKDDAFTLKGIHDSFQHMFEVTLKSKSLYKSELNKLLLEINYICINTNVSHHISTNVKDEKKIIDVLNQTVMDLNDRVKKIHKENNRKIVTGNIVSLTDINTNLGKTKIINVIQFLRLLDEMENNDDLIKVLATLQKLKDRFNEFIQASCAPLKAFMHRMIIDPNTMKHISAELLSKSPQPLTSSPKLFDNTVSSSTIVPNQNIFKIFVVGESGCGKTSFVLKLTRNIFSEQPEKIKSPIKFNLNSEQIHITDYNSLDFSTYASSPLRTAHAFIILFDVTKPNALNEVKRHLAEINRCCHENVPIVIAGNKADNSSRQVTTEDASEFATYLNHFYFDVSSKNGLNLQEPVLTLLDILKSQNDDEFIFEIKKNKGH